MEGTKVSQFSSYFQQVNNPTAIYINFQQFFSQQGSAMFHQIPARAANHIQYSIYTIKLKSRHKTYEMQTLGDLPNTIIQLPHRALGDSFRSLGESASFDSRLLSASDNWHDMSLNLSKFQSFYLREKFQRGVSSFVDERAMIYCFSIFSKMAEQDNFEHGTESK